MKNTMLAGAAALLSILAGPLLAAEWVCLQAEQFEHCRADRRNFGGVVGVVFPKPDSAIRTRFTVPKAVRAELWARVYFPWGGQDAAVLTLDKRRFPIDAGIGTAAGRWDVGNYQVWHWVRAGGASVKAGEHEIAVAPVGRAGQRVDQVVLAWGPEPAWAQPWLAAGIDPPAKAPPWPSTGALVLPAVDFHAVEASVETLGRRKVAVLRGDGDRLGTVFRTSKPLRVRLWARVYFEAKNMFEGLTMQEMASNLYLHLDGRLVKTVYEQNARLWHWVAADEPTELKPGLHLVSLRKHGGAVKVDRVVLHAGGAATAEPWFRSPAPPPLPFGLASAPEGARAGNWRIHAVGKAPAATFLGERLGPARFPVRLEFGPEAATVDLLHAASLDENPAHGDRTPAQRVGLWARGSLPGVRVEVLYTDRHGEAFLQALEAPPGAANAGWRLLSAGLPIRLTGKEVFFDNTGYATDVAATPAATAAGGRTSGIRRAGGDRNAVPDFPLEVRALRLVKPAGKATVTLGDPFFDSPFSLRARLPAATADRATFEIEVRNASDAPATASVSYRFGDRQADLLDEAMRTAVLQQRRLAVPARGRKTFSITLERSHPGIHYLEARLGPCRPLRRFVAFGEVWRKELARLRRGRERRAGAFRFSPDGRDRALKTADGKPLAAEHLPAAYGADKGLVVTDDGLDVCSLAYAEKRGYAYPIRPRGWDLSDEAGWPDVPVPNGTLAIDPLLGRLKFAEANPQRLCLRSAVKTGFGVPGPRIAVRGRFAYPGPGEGHYSVVDCSDRTRPRVVGQICSWYFSHGLLPFGNYAYFEPSRRGLVLVDDLGNPYRPGPLRAVHFNRARYGRLTHVFEEQAVGYSVGGSEPALWAFDLAQPLYPREIAKLPGLTAFVPRGGGRAFTYAGDRVRMLDVSRPRKPVLLDGGVAREKWTDGRKKQQAAGLFAASGQYLALRVDRRIDVYRYTAEKAFAAERIARLDLPKKSGPHVFGTFHENLLYVLDGKEGPGQYSLGARSPASRWFVYEIGKGEVKQVGLYEHPWPSAFGSITIEGRSAYVSDYNYGLWTFDLSDPRKPKRLGGAVTAGESDALWLDGDRAYQWQTFGGAVFLLDLADPAAPRRLGEYWDGAWLPYGNTRRSNQTVAGKDGFLYVPRQQRGLLVVDVRDPARPKLVGEFKDAKDKPLTAIWGACIDVRGDLACVLARTKLLLYDVSRAAAPRRLATLTVPQSDLICARGDRVYLGHRDGLLTVVNVADPARPAVSGRLDLKPTCPAKTMSEVLSGLTVHRGYAYLTGRGPSDKGTNYLHVVDVRDGAKPRWITTFDPRPDLPDAPCSLWSDFYQDLVADGDYLFLGDYGEIQCLDISRPTAPRLLDVLHVGYQWSVGRKRGEHLFVPALAGLLVLRAPSSSQAPTGKLEARGRL